MSWSMYMSSIFGRKIPSWDISVWKSKRVDNFSRKVHIGIKNRPIQKLYHICLLNFKSFLIAKKLEFILSSFLSDDVRNLAYGKKIHFWTNTDRFYFRRHSIALDELIKVYVINFLVEKFLHEIYQFESLKGLTLCLWKTIKNQNKKKQVFRLKLRSNFKTEN